MRNGHKKRYLGALTGALLLVGAAGFGLYLDAGQPKADTKNRLIGQHSLSEGRVVSGRDTGSGNAIATDSRLTYESPKLATGLPKANAVAVNWTQTGKGDAQLEVRTNDGKGWSGWSMLEGDDLKDGAPEQSAMLLTANAHQTQYRFRLRAKDGTLRVSKPKVFAIDATTGPDPAKHSLISRIFGDTAAAVSAPRIYSRSEWGSSQPNSSPKWTPRYWKLRRAMVHHTVSNATTSFSGSAANVRAIWYQHAINNRWGDIGYNYLVDQRGRIFQGRYYSKPYSAAWRKEVEGGHTYRYNDYSIGIAALGNFQRTGPSSALLENIGKIAGFRIAKYGLGGTAMYRDEKGRSQYRVAGHRNYTSTACPGYNLYRRMPTIRKRAQAYRNVYIKKYTYDYGFVSKGVNSSPGSSSLALDSGQTGTLYITLKNIGWATWKNTGKPRVHLGTDRPRDRVSVFADDTWVTRNRPMTFDNQSVGGYDGNVATVQPGESAHFSFQVTAPNQAGTWKEYFRPVADWGGGWFYRDLAINWTLTVNAGPSSLSSPMPSPSSAVLPASPTASPGL